MLGTTINSAILLAIPSIFLLTSQPAIPLFWITMVALGLLSVRDPEPFFHHAPRVIWLSGLVLLITALVAPFALNLERHLERAAKISLYLPLIPLGYLVARNMSERWPAAAKRLMIMIVSGIVAGQALVMTDIATGLRVSAPFRSLRAGWTATDLNDSTIIALISLFSLCIMLNGSARFIFTYFSIVFVLLIYYISPSDMSLLICSVSIFLSIFVRNIAIVNLSCLFIFFYLLGILVFPYAMVIFYQHELFVDLLRSFSSSLHSRIAIYTAVSEFILSKNYMVLLGNGFSAMRDIDMPAPADVGGLLTWQTHPHNALLQIMLDLGIWGVLGTTLIAYRLIRWLRAESLICSASVSIAIIGSGIVTLLANDVWHDWWWSFLVTLAAFLGLVAGTCQQAAHTCPDRSSIIADKRSEGR